MPTKNRGKAANAAIGCAGDGCLGRVLPGDIAKAKAPPVISPAMLPNFGISEVQGTGGVYLQRNDVMFTAMKHTAGEFSDFFRALRDERDRHRLGGVIMVLGARFGHFQRALEPRQQFVKFGHDFFPISAPVAPAAVCAGGADAAAESRGPSSMR